MDTIIVAVFFVTAIGAVCAAVLSLASKFMHVAVDERLIVIQEALPGLNCGACGYPGCSGYARALVEDGNVKTNLCTPGGPRVNDRLSGILGVRAEDAAVKFALLHCRGDCNALQKKMDYEGIKTCMAANQLFGGEGACSYGCIGYGDCQTICPVGAISIENELVRINTKLCTGCGLCIKACPNNLISLECDSKAPVVLCKGLEKGAVARKKCSNCCLGCGKCMRECPSAAITIEENLARIEYEKCICCGHCSEICPTHCIRPLGQFYAG